MLGHSGKFIVGAFILTLSLPVWAEDGDLMSDWQKDRLFNPDSEQLEREQQGFVFIYSGLKDTDVVAALDSEYNRIENMMFVRTVHTDRNGDVLRNSESGEIVRDDDGC